MLGIYRKGSRMERLGEGWLEQVKKKQGEDFQKLIFTERYF